MSYESKPLELSLLSVNIENPRFEMVGNQREAIAQMIEDQGTKLVKLAQNIIDNGLNPSELVLVTPHEKTENQFNVLEGNRRICALKLMANPDLIPEKNKSLLISFKKLSEHFYKNPITAIPCVIFSNESDAYRWIKLKHTGENDGVGVVSWDAQQKARFDERVEGKSSYAIQIIDFLKNQNISEELKKELPNLPSSSFQRLITDPDFRKTVGLEIKDQKVFTNLPAEEVVKSLTKVIKDLLREDFTVKEIYYKDDRLNYLETFKPSELPNKTTTFKESWELTKNNPPSKVNTIAAAAKSTKKSSKPLSTSRNSIIPKSCIIHINQPRVNKIYRELKDLDLREFCNAGAITFRVFIELSIDSFIEEQKIVAVTKDDKLRRKVEEVANFLEKNGHLDKHKLKAIRNSVANNTNILSIETFNSYVHNKDLNPVENELKVAWDNIENFIVKLWELI